MRKLTLIAVVLCISFYLGCSYTINPTLGGLKISPSIYDFGKLLIGEKKQVDFTLRNNYKNIVSLSVIDIQGNNVNDFKIVAGNITPAKISNDGEYVISVRFEPIREGQRSAYLNIEFNVTGGRIICQLKGSAVNEPIIEVTPASYDYGDVAVGAKVDAEFTIKNTGNKPLSVSRIEVINDSAGSFSISEGATVGSTSISINPGSSHVVKVQFMSLSAGIKTGKLRIAHNADSITFFGDLKCNASTEVSLSPFSYEFEDTEIGNSSESFTFTVSNPLSSVVKITSISILTNPSDFSADPVGNGNWSVPANGGTFEINVTFNPTETDLCEAVLKIVTTQKTLTADLSGTGFAKPTFEIFPTEYDFGTVEAYNTKIVKFTVTNNGSTTLRLDSVSIQNDSDDSFILMSGKSGTTITEGSYAVIEIKFFPQSLGFKNAILRIEHNADDLPVFVNLTGMAATIALTPTIYDFGNVGVNITPALEKEFQVVNATFEPIVVTNIDIAGDGGTSFSVSPSGNGSWTVSPGGEPLKLKVFCSPRKETDLWALLKVTYQNGQLTSELKARGIAMPSFSISPETHNFGTVNLTSYKTFDFTLRNTGASELTVSDISIIDDPTDSYEVIFGGLTNGSTTIPKSNYRIVRVKFEPKAFGTCNAKLHIEHNANGSPFDGNLFGAGTGPYLTIIPKVSEYDFGEQFVGESSETVFYLHNPGNANVIVSNIYLSNYAMFSVEHDDFPIYLSPGKVSVVKARYEPKDSGNHECVLNVVHSSVDSPLAVTLKGRGKRYRYFLSENFEGSSAPTDWWATSNSDWEWGSPRNVGPSSAYEGSRCYGTQIDANYRSNQNCVLVSPRIDLSQSVNPILSFSMWLYTQTNYDGCWVEISTNDGGSWTPLTSPDPGYNSNLYVSGSNKSAWTGNWSSSGWRPVKIDLTAYKGNSQVRLLWYFYSNSSTVYPGVYFDNIRIFEDIGPDTPRNPVPVVNDVSVPVISNSFPLKWDCDEGTKYDVYLDTVYPPTNKVASGIGQKQFNASLQPDKTYYWQVVAHNTHDFTKGPIWFFKTVDGVPKFLINEVDTSNPADYIEFYNTESYMVYIGKWQMSAYDNNSLQGVYEFDDYTIVYPGELIVLYDSHGASTERFRTSFNINWSTITSIGEVILQYPITYNSRGVDYMRFNLVVPNNIPADLSWSGLLTAGSSSDMNWYRRRTTDNDNADDWRSRSFTSDKGVKNPGQ